jgi:hypothetical protein
LLGNLYRHAQFLASYSAPDGGAYCVDEDSNDVFESFYPQRVNKFSNDVSTGVESDGLERPSAGGPEAAIIAISSIIGH